MAPPLRVSRGLGRLLGLALALAALAGLARADERATARRFEEARKDEPSLVAFLRAMPKGGDLHHHFPVGLFAEDALEAAIRRGLHFDPATALFEAETGPGRVPAERLRADDALRYRYLNAAGMRTVPAGAAQGHDHFFAAFGPLLSSTGADELPAVLAATVARARAQGIQYLELMANPAPQAFHAVKAAALATDTPEGLPRRLKPLIDDYVTAARIDLDRWEAAVRGLGFDSRGAGPATPVSVRYQTAAYRGDPDPHILAAWAAGLALRQADPRVVGVNFLGPEDHPVAREGFERHMRILDGLWHAFGQPSVALHAGELTLQVSPVEPLRSRIRRSIEVGRARRIGHGISIAWEDDLPGLLARMRQEGIAVEVCPSSNALILGVEGDRHPFHLYRRAGVPVVIATDDEGINRSNLTLEYLRAVRAWGLSYRDVKALVRNSLEYSFLSGPSLFEARDYGRVRPAFRALRARGWDPTPAEAALLAVSDKATVQAGLERALHHFERGPGPTAGGAATGGGKTR